MFHRKVHPENSIATQKSNKTQKTENKKKLTHNGDYHNGDQVPPDEEIVSYPKMALSKESIRRYKSQSNPPQFTLSSSDSNGNREHWIKTDADCKYRFILHLQNPLWNRNTICFYNFVLIFKKSYLIHVNRSVYILQFYVKLVLLFLQT